MSVRTSDNEVVGEDGLNEVSKINRLSTALHDNPRSIFSRT